MQSPRATSPSGPARLPIMPRPAPPTGCRSSTTGMWHWSALQAVSTGPLTPLEHKLWGLHKPQTYTCILCPLAGHLQGAHNSCAADLVPGPQPTGMCRRLVLCCMCERPLTGASGCMSCATAGHVRAPVWHVLRCILVLCMALRQPDGPQVMPFVAMSVWYGGVCNSLQE